jgi:hypothetical protein
MLRSSVRRQERQWSFVGLQIRHKPNPQLNADNQERAALYYLSIVVSRGPFLVTG